MIRTNFLILITILIFSSNVKSQTKNEDFIELYSSYIQNLNFRIENKRLTYNLLKTEQKLINTELNSYKSIIELIKEGSDESASSYKQQYKKVKSELKEINILLSDTTKQLDYIKKEILHYKEKISSINNDQFLKNNEDDISKLKKELINKIEISKQEFVESEKFRGIYQERYKKRTLKTKELLQKQTSLLNEIMNKKD